MKTNLVRLSIFWLVTVLAQSVHGKIITLTVNQTTNSVTIAANEVATIKFFDSVGDAVNVILYVAKDDVELGFNPRDFADTQRYPIVAGPATITLIGRGLITIEISPETFPPDKTLIIPQGTGARVGLETSTNLTQWVEIWSNIYTNVPSNTFFRIRADRLQ